jgi:hypothetical protein
MWLRVGVMPPQLHSGTGVEKLAVLSMAEEKSTVLSMAEYITWGQAPLAMRFTVVVPWLFFECMPGPFHTT